MRNSGGIIETRTVSLSKFQVKIENRVLIFPVYLYVLKKPVKNGGVAKTNLAGENSKSGRAVILSKIIESLKP